MSVFLDGGNDGLNTLVPVTGSDYAAYVTKRPNIALNPANCLPLAGPAATPDWRWNPAATGFQQLYDAGKLAVIPAVDYMPPDLSHFHSRAFWQAGELDPDPDTGWLGRWIDQNGDPANPLQAISAGWSLDGVLKSASKPVAVLSSVDDAQFWLNNVWSDQQLMMDTLAALPQRSAASAAMDAADNAVGGAVNVANRLKALSQPTLPPTGLGYGGSDFDKRMANLAWLLDSNLGMRVACVSYDDGWDFHDSQQSRQASNLSGLSTTLAAFQADLEARGLAQPGDHAGLERVRPPRRGQQLRRRRHRPRRRRPGAGDGHAGQGAASPRAFPGIADSDLDAVGQPEGADRLPADLHQPAGQLDGHRPGRCDPQRGQLHTARSGRLTLPYCRA